MRKAKHCQFEPEDWPYNVRRRVYELYRDRRVHPAAGRRLVELDLAAIMSDGRFVLKLAVIDAMTAWLKVGAWADSRYKYRAFNECFALIACDINLSGSASRQRICLGHPFEIGVALGKPRSRRSPRNLGAINLRYELRV